MSTLSPAQIAAYVRGAGIPEELVPKMTAIALAESSGNPGAHNPNASTGDNSYGLFQVNMIGGMGPERRRQFGLSSNEELFDPAQNAAAAKKILESQGLGAWSVHKSGAYQKFMDQAREGSNSPAALPSSPRFTNSQPVASGYQPMQFAGADPVAIAAAATMGVKALTAPSSLSPASNPFASAAAGVLGMPGEPATMPASSGQSALGGIAEDAIARIFSQSPQLAQAGGMGESAMPAAARIGGGQTNRKPDPDAEKTGFDIVFKEGVGAPIIAPVDLEITGSGFQGQGQGETGRGYGNWLSGRFAGADGKPYELLLGHLDQFGAKPGTVVRAGQPLGTQGITGRAFGAHVSTHVNPLQGGDPWKELNRLTDLWTGPA